MSRTWFLQSEAQGAQIALDPLPFRVGRATHLELVLPSEAVSKEHAEIVREGEELRVRDLGSKNGTFVNGARVREVPLRLGDSVHFGDAKFRIGASPGVADIYWKGSLVGRVEETRIETVECAPGVPPAVRSANLSGRWVRLPGGSADAFAHALEEAAELEVLIDGIDGIGVGQFRGAVGWFSLGEGGEALVRIRH